MLLAKKMVIMIEASVSAEEWKIDSQSVVSGGAGGTSTMLPRSRRGAETSRALVSARR